MRILYRLLDFLRKALLVKALKGPPHFQRFHRLAPRFLAHLGTPAGDFIGAFKVHLIRQRPDRPSARAFRRSSAPGRSDKHMPRWTASSTAARRASSIGNCTVAMRMLAVIFARWSSGAWRNRWQARSTAVLVLSSFITRDCKRKRYGCQIYDLQGSCAGPGGNALKR